MGKKIRFPDHVLKIISLLIAIGLWLFVSFEENPKTEFWFEGVPITYVNDNLENYNVKRITDTEEKTVSIKVRGTRGDILGLTSDDIIANVDLATIKKMGHYSLSYSISFPINGFEVVDKKPYIVSTEVARLVAKNFDVKITTSGTLPEGCEIGEITSSISKVIVTGPDDLVKRVSGCSADVDINNRKTIINSPAEIKILLDDNTYYSGNDLSISNTYTNVNIEILSEKEVAVVAKVENTGEGEIGKITISPETIRVKGSVSILDSLENIETHTLYVTEYSKEQEAALNLPEGLTVKDEVKSVNVKVEYKE